MNTKVTDESFNPSGSDVIHGIKTRVNDLASFVQENVPTGRRRSVAMTQLEQAAMWAVKAAAVGDK